MAKVKILCVDDEEPITNSLYYTFCNDYDVLTANQPHEAIELIKKNKDIKLILSDQMMPSMTGCEFLEQAKEIVPDAYRVLLTGFANSDDMREYVANGVIQKLLAKPWGLDELTEIAKDVVSNKL